jgi:hypothetical protein
MIGWSGRIWKKSCNKWVTIMMECISTVSYSILINGEPHGYIKPSRGLRQGDPLSPYLFLLCAEGLHSLLQRAKNARDIHGVSISRSGPKLTHLFFVDDSLLFCKATTNEIRCIQNILTEYEHACFGSANKPPEDYSLFQQLHPTAHQG